MKPGSHIFSSARCWSATIPRCVHVAILFTWTDYKTILLPVTTFACSTAPIHSLSDFLHTLVFIWFHLLLCNISNQARSKDEDAINRPWRPLPSGLITEAQAIWLRYATALFCLLWSVQYGWELVLVTTALIATTWVYDEGGGSKTVIGKNLCNVGGYVAFEVGATRLMGVAHGLDTVSLAAICISGVLIFTTIQAQDFADVEGDAASGRVTFPVYAPELSRAFTLFAVIAWSMFLGWFWHLGPMVSAALGLFGVYVGARYYLCRTVEMDEVSYLIFNVWLMCANILPLHARTGVLGF
ncbi:UbiA prenyltransferase family [Roridomyces roridus]|uniref:UbiA prenyltransferase family n=1 Tax=Roridomyces roridus TaxID=1738132 RepID=A0AAD7FV77_9AGAR|nr:UbiA prenyltransferase family [Roridomyces roridus]